jgi:hypothetical protein
MAYQNLDQWTPQLPRNRQPGVTYEQWEAHAIAGHCEQLLKGVCAVPCDLRPDGTYPVSEDHMKPQIQGGDHSICNTRFLCPRANSSKRDRPDPIWSKLHPFFDQPLNAEALRTVQRTKGADLVRSHYRSLFRNPPDELYKVFMVLSWLVGTGKTLGMAGIALAINQMRRESEPAGGWRIKRALWLVHQEALVQSTAVELGGMVKGKRVIQSELVEHGICTVAPKVQTIEKVEDWRIGMNADIVIATPQSLWETDARVLTKEQKIEILAGFEMIVVDECQYAVERYVEICELAPKSFKFAVSSTHIDKDGTFLSQVQNGKYRDIFRLFSAAGYDPEAGIYKKLNPVFSNWEGNESLIEQAIADYQQDATQPNISRQHRRPFPAIDGRFYFRVSGGMAEVAQGTSVVGHVNDDSEHLNSVRKMAVVNRCREIASDPSWKYDPHIMLKFGSIKECQFFAQEIDKRAKAHNAPTWGATAVYSGSKGEHLGSPDHPWMLAKSNGGKVKKGSKRFVCVVNIGQFGINQPACAIIGWCDTLMTQIDIVQRIGRAIRARPGIGGDIRFVWNAASDPDYKFTIELHKAVQYIINMEQLVTDAFISLQDLIDPAPLQVRPGRGQPLLKERKLELTEVLGNELLVDPEASADELVDRVGHVIYGGSNGRMPDQAKEFIRDLVQRGPEVARTVKDDLFCLPSAMVPISYIKKEEPSREFTQEEVFKAIMSCEISEQAREFEWHQYQDDAKGVRETWHDRLYRQRIAEYAVPSASFHPHDILGVSTDRARKKSGRQAFGLTYSKRLEQILAPSLRHSATTLGFEFNAVINEARGHVRQALFRAARKAFGLPNFQEVTFAPMKDQIAHALCAPDVERTILSLAYGRVISRMQPYFPGLHYVMGDQITTVSQHVEDEGNAE